MRQLFVLIIFLLGLGSCNRRDGGEILLLNVSYDPTRELFRDVNAAFSREWNTKTGRTLVIRQSHGGSGKQARAVIDGLSADVVTLALSYDIDQIAKKALLLPAAWRQRLPYGSTPYTSTIVFLVRKGNPYGIRDWNDLLKPGVSIIAPSPKSSGGARWNYLAALAFARVYVGGDESKALEFVRDLYRRVPVLDTGARAATTTFAQRGIGDVLITWENEAHLTLQALGSENFEIVVPSISVLAEPPVAVIDKNVDAHHTRDVAQAYLEFLYSDEGQELAAKHFYRPRNEQIAARYQDRFPALTLVAIDQAFGGWDAAQKEHFVDGGTFDRIFEKGS